MGILPRRKMCFLPRGRGSKAPRPRRYRDRSRMFFLDSSDHKEIADICAWGVVSGVTTNPLILAREGGSADLEPRIRAVVAASTGPVSVELTSETESEML